MVSLTNLSFNYRKQPALFEGLNLELYPGNIYGLLGKNGAGKTTLLKNMMGLAFPSAGRCTVGGFDAAKRQPAFLRSVFFLPEEPDIPNASATAFVDVTRPFYPDFDDQQFEQCLDAFEVPRRRVLSKLSLGQQKKFMISFALACCTPLVVMDEPTNGLDIPSKIQFRKVIAAAFDQNRCMVISTHQVKDLENLIDTVLVLHERQIALHARLEALATKVSFGTVSAAALGDALYYEETFNGIRAIMPNLAGIQSQPDLELLFNAVTANHARLADYLKQ